jgi:hypothetical protein
MLPNPTTRFFSGTNNKIEVLSTREFPIIRLVEQVFLCQEKYLAGKGPLEGRASVACGRYIQNKNMGRQMAFEPAFFYGVIANSKVGE